MVEGMRFRVEGIRLYATGVEGLGALGLGSWNSEPCSRSDWCIFSSPAGSNNKLTGAEGLGFRV